MPNKSSTCSSQWWSPISAEGGQVSLKGTPVFSPGIEFISKKNQYYYVVTPKYPVSQLIQNLILELTNI